MRLAVTRCALAGAPQVARRVQKNEIASSSGPWTDAPQFLTTYANAVQGWTGSLSPGCNNSQGLSTGGTNPLSGNNLTWKMQSIVNGNGGAFSWPPSSLGGLGGWACYSYQTDLQPPTCFAAGTECPNNSGPEGEQFYIAVNNGGGPPTNYVLTGIQQCNGAEGVGDPKSVDPDVPSENGKQAIETHMEQNCVIPQQ